MIEIEKTYLAKELPQNLGECKFKEIIDVYIPKASVHPSLRLRKDGDNFELTKKELIDEGDHSHAREQTIVLTEKEFDALNQQIKGKRVRKIRYNYDYNGTIVEFDIFQDALKGLILVDVEFESIDEKDNFQMPDFCLADVTEEDFIAGGMVCGKGYQDIADNLNRFEYKKLVLE
ncbi:MAG: hypothetical protein ACKUBY_03580 [Candidatus Moraniibacteriota bacterium]|jgi:adenylate cyclase